MSDFWKTTAAVIKAVTKTLTLVMWPLPGHYGTILHRLLLFYFIVLPISNMNLSYVCVLIRGSVDYIEL